MRPLYLKMSAFGPFAGVAEVDFTLLGTEGIYLLAGETGAGKTTVFDAITFALFGQCSGESRKPEDLRSDYAGPETQTYVDLTFELRGKRYRVRRDPGGYQRAKRRGEGTTQCLGESVLELPDGTQLSGKRVTEKVTELLGIDANQFGQIVMLAQGDFEKLLTEGTKERTAIFRKIFGTSMYQRFQDELVSQRKDLAQLCEQGAHEAEILAKQAVACMGEGDEPRARLEDWMGRNALQAANALEAAREEQSLLDARHEEALQALKLAQDTRDGRARELDRARQAETARAEERKAQQRLTDVDARLPGLEARMEASAQACEQVPALQQRAGALREQLPSYAAHTEALAQERTADQALDAAEKDRAAQATALEEARAEVARLEGVAQALSGAREALARADGQVANTRRDLDAALQLQESRSTVQTCDAKIEADDIRFEKADAFLTKLDEADVEDARALDACTKRQAELADTPDRLAQAQLDAQAARAEADQAHRLSERLGQLEGDLADKRETHRRAAERYATAARESEACTQALASLRRSYEDGLAGVLAAGLKDGDPCPVCGSPVHPRPAAAERDTPSKEGIEAAQARDEAARAHASALCGEAKAAHELVQAAQAARDTFVEENGDGAALEDRISQLAVRLRATAQEVTRLEGDNADLEEARREQARLHEQTVKRANKRQEAHELLISIREDLATCRATRQAALDAISAAGQTPEGIGALLAQAREALTCAQDAQAACTRDAQALDQARARLDAAKVRLQGAEERAEAAQQALEQARRTRQVAQERARLTAERLEYTDETAARGALAALESQVQQATKGLEEAQAAVQACKTERARVASRLETLRRQLDELGGLDTLQASAALTAAQQELDGAQARERKAGQARATLSRLSAGLAQLAEKDAGLQARFARLERLSRVADGSMQGTERLTFETFVQMRYFEVVLAAANTRLSEMTQGQYELVRCERAEGGTAKAGLNVDVLDNFTGKARSAKSLSGGEKFMASLALALGLSEVVQRQSGGIQLDTMFVDEGFGSLDQEKLRLVMRAMSRPGASGKLVGIISHVEELMGTIDRKIVVERTPAGSTLHVEV